MKIKIIIAVAVLAIAGVGAFVVADDAESMSSEQLERMRGMNGYYIGDLITIEDPAGKELLMNLADGKIVKVGFNGEYRLGREWQDSPELATSAFTAKAIEVRSEIITLVAGKSADKFTGADLLQFKQQVIEIMNTVVFPKKMARIEKLHFSALVIQG